jgi:alpha-mannosidase
MRRSVLVAVLISFSSSLPLGAGTNVDTLVEALELASSAPFDHWKMSTSFGALEKDVERLSDPSFDDAAWQDLSLGGRVYVDSCWLRKEAMLPKFIAGHPVRGEIGLLLSVDDYGYLWVNGEEKGRFPWDGEFVLSEGAAPGQRLVLLVKAVNTGGPLRLLRARPTSADMHATQEAIRDFSLSLRVGAKLTGFDTYQTNARLRTDPGTDRSKMKREEKEKLSALLESIAPQVDIEALHRGDRERFWSSVAKVQKKLGPIAEFAKRFTLHFDSNAHIDAAWLWREKETVEVCRRTFSSVIEMMKTRPDFTYTQSQAALYKWMEEDYPELFREMQEMEEAGRWETVGGMWVEPDCNLPSGVSWSRQLLFGQRYFEKHFGERVKIGWNPDSFGYNWNMPQFFRKSGIDVFVTQKIGWNDTNVFPHRVFWWEAPDGSRVLTYFPFNYVDTIEDPFRLVDWLRQFEANTGFTRLLILFGVGDHGGGPSPEMLERVDHLKDIDIFPRVEFGKAGTYLDWLKGQDLTAIPVWRDELYLEHHRGTYTTQANTKKANRTCETLLVNAEIFSAIGTLFGREYNETDLDEAWEKVLFNQFHDILPGSSIREVYHDAQNSYREAREIATFELAGALGAIAGQVNTIGCPDGEPVLVYNPLAWERSGIASVKLSPGKKDPKAVFDLEGNEIPSQIVSKGKYEREIIFAADGIPSLGYRVYLLRKQIPSRMDTDLKMGDRFLENEFFRVTVDPDSGWVAGILDKRSGREILAGTANRLQIFDDRPVAWDAWDIGLGEEFPSRFRKIEVVENGPVRAVLRVSRDFLKPGTVKEFPTEDFPSSFFQQDIVLYAGSDLVNFSTGVEWWEERTMLKVAFPLAVQDTLATYEIPYGTIARSTTLVRDKDRGKYEVPSHRWADLSSPEYGVSLLNNAKYGYDTKGNVMRLSLLRSPNWPDPTADRGDHTIEYALFPHEGGWRAGGTVRRGYEFNSPLLTVTTDRHQGSLPPVQSFATLSPGNLVLASIKAAEDDPQAWVVQWYDARGIDCEAVLTLPKKPKEARLSNFLEDDAEPLVVKGNRVMVSTGANEVVTVKVDF